MLIALFKLQQVNKGKGSTHKLGWGCWGDWGLIKTWTVNVLCTTSFLCITSMVELTLWTSVQQNCLRDVMGSWVTAQGVLCPWRANQTVRSSQLRLKNRTILHNKNHYCKRMDYFCHHVMEWKEVRRLISCLFPLEMNNEQLHCLQWWDRDI